jgi:hypothetical protein
LSPSAGGLLVLHGEACSVTLKQCSLERCTLVALDGAKATLESCMVMSDLIGVYASGRGTSLQVVGRTTITGGMQARAAPRTAAVMVSVEG